MCVIVHLEPSEVRQDQSRVVGGDTGPSVAHTNHIFDTLADKKKHGLGVSLVLWGL